MILSNEEVTVRIESPLNLLNRLKESITPATRGKADIPFLPPSSDKLIEGLDSKIAFGGLKTKAAGIMNQALSELELRVTEAKSPKELAAIATEMSRVITGEVANNRNDKPAPQVVIYAPRETTEEDFETITVHE